MSSIVVNEDEIKDYNQVKDIVLEQLSADGVLSKKVADEYMAKYNVIIIKPTWFSQVSNFFKKTSKNNIGSTKTYIKIFKY